MVKTQVTHPPERKEVTLVAARSGTSTLQLVGMSLQLLGLVLQLLRVCFERLLK